MFAADWDGSELRIREHHLYITRLYLVSVHLEPSAELAQLRERLRATPELTQRSPAFLFYLVVDKLVDSLFIVLDRIDDETDVLQDRILERPSNDILSQISSLKRAVVNLRKVLGAQRDLFQRLTSSTLAEPDTAIYFRDVHDHIVRQYETVDSLRDILTGAMDIYLTTVSQRLNDVMRRLTVIATLFMPLSFITGFFGMNFGWLVARITEPGAFALGIGLMMATIAMQFLYFRRRGWV
jgi:magnesium transporter